MRIAIVAIAVCPLLSGCFFIGTIQENQRQAELTARNNAAEADFKARAAQCDAEAKGKSSKGYAAYRACYNEALIEKWKREELPGLDLLQVATAKRYEVAERFDQKKLSKSQVAVVEAEIWSEFVSALEKRAAQREIVAAAQQQADAASYQAYAANRSVTCNRYGNSVTCF